jgi:hypothetical protein
MRKLIFLPILLMVFLLTTQSCTKQSRDEIGIKESETITAIVSISNPYVLNVNNYSDVSIGKQAEHADISKTEVIGESGTRVYRYVPKAGYTGVDEVELAVLKSSYGNGGSGCSSIGGNGASRSYNRISRVLIKFTVTN